MKILIATGIYPPEIGGPATYTKMLEKHLPQYGHEIFVAPYGWVRRYPKIIRHFVFVWKLIQESKGCDVVYALDPVSVGLPVCIASFVTRKPFILRIAGDYAWEQGQQRFGITAVLDTFIQEKQKHPFVLLLQSIQAGVAKRALGIVVPSNYMKSVVHAWGISQEKIQVIYSALFPLEVRETKEEIQKMFKYSGTIISTAGRLVPWKGMKLLIEILPELQKKVPDINLVIVGDGPLREDLESFAEECGVSDTVRFVGRLEKHALGPVIKGSDVFVLNTAYEGLSHQLLEVMDLEIPVVTTDVGGNTELIEDKKTGLLIPYNDKDALMNAILSVVEEKEMAENMVALAKKRTQDFDQSKLIADLDRYIKGIMTNTQHESS